MVSRIGFRFPRGKQDWWITIPAILILVASLSLLLRDPVLKMTIDAKRQAFNRRYGADLRISAIRFCGIASVEATGITLLPPQGDTLLSIDTAYASLAVSKLLLGRVALVNVRLIRASLLLQSRDSITNYGFLLHRASPIADSASRHTNLATAADRLVQFIFDKIPLRMSVRNLQVAGESGNHRVLFRVKRLDLEDQFFRSQVEVTESGRPVRWNLAGKVDKPRRVAEFRLWSADSSTILLPWLKFKWNARIGFDTLAFSVAGQGETNGITSLGGFASVSGLVIDHPMIAGVPVRFEKTGIKYLFHVGRNEIEMDSATGIGFNRIEIHPYIRYSPGPPKTLTLRVHTPPFSAQDLFSSFPEGLFTNLDGLRVKGELSWHLDFAVDLSRPDSLEFGTSLDRRQFGVLSYGNADLTKINEPFEYTAYDHGEPVRTFTVGPSHPGFRPLGKISPYLQHAVLTSEDGAFFEHRGFLPDAFRESIIENIKQRRFARGGSTISMQLVKNVFLSRNKTVARKMEEALLVWLLENQGLSTKERMFEVYLNIIEWGPLVYGAEEASRFYFNKDASRLTLAEAIFLASIIPRPKWFRSSFDETGKLRDFNAAFYSLVAEKMLRKGWITPEEAVGLVPEVTLTGPARQLLRKTDSLPPDTLLVPLD